MRTLLALSLLGLATLSAAADEVATREIRMKSGDTIRAAVIEVTDDGVVVEFEGMPGSRGKIPLENLEDVEVFQIEVERVRPRSVEDWLYLADVAQKRKLHDLKHKALKRAVELDPKREDVRLRLDELEEVLFEEKIAQARQLVKDGDPERARGILLVALEDFRGRSDEPEARALLQQATDQIRVARAGRNGTRPEVTASLPSDLLRVRSLIARAENLMTRGRQKLDRKGAAIEDFQGALILYRRAARETGAFRTGTMGGFYPDETTKLELGARDGQRGACVELGYAYLYRGSLNKAQDYAGEASAIDPNHPSVNALKAAIGAAATRGIVR